MAFDQVTKSDGFQEKVITSERHAKTTKGGRLFSFAACVVVGDGKGHIGFSNCSAREVSVAMSKASEKARRNMSYVKLVNQTVPHRVEASFGTTTKVVILPAKSTGIIAGGPLRAFFEVLGVKHVVAKIIGSRNPINVIRAALKACEQIQTADDIKAKLKSN